ncbi:MAG: flagellar assembly protein T N-terminal domain-containing protein [Methylococcales bacterium]|nr:flagellar assembly protein T N-terminal domain-containing protein [Methylococcales bacterium]MDD5755299.1 flagellar assembly protein T N-terminal domain-containing protein [Methylococcales bacterium]
MATLLFRLAALGVLLSTTSCTNFTAHSAPPSSNITTVEGQAVVHNGAVLLAKKQALQDAIRVASQQSSVAVHSQSSLSNNNLQLDSMMMRSAAAVSNTKVLREWEADGIYHVKAMVELSPNGMCQQTYRKRILATAFPRVAQEQISDYETNDLDNGIPREINNLLMESSQFIGINATNIAIYPRPDLAPETQERSDYQAPKVVQLANKAGAQFVLSGVIRDLEIASDEYMQGSGIAALVNSWGRHLSGKRNIGIDVYVHDGMSGALLLQRRYVDKSEGDVMIPASYTVGSDGFRTTETGKKITEIINKASVDIQQALNCYPFATRIADIKGNKIFIDAGAQEKLNIGDQLIVYGTASDGLHLEGGSSFVTSDKQPVSVLTIQSITPRYAIGSIEGSSSKLGIKIGDWVRSQ